MWKFMWMRLKKEGERQPLKRTIICKEMSLENKQIVTFSTFCCFYRFLGFDASIFFMTHHLMRGKHYGFTRRKKYSPSTTTCRKSNIICLCIKPKFATSDSSIQMGPAHLQPHVSPELNLYAALNRPWQEKRLLSCLEEEDMEYPHPA